MVKKKRNSGGDDVIRGGGAEFALLDDVDVDRLNIDDEDGRRNEEAPRPPMMDSDTRREVARQMEALDAAAQMRKQRRQRANRGILLPSIADKNIEDDEGGSDEDDDNLLQLGLNDLDDLDLLAAPAAFVSTHDGDAAGGGGNAITSRYQTDFVEIAHLGRGGGGEVVQAINRLDRRVYAIKKIHLEPEDDNNNDVVDDGIGSNEERRRRRAAKRKWAAMQNEKLRREVTTISMMFHKNIVRYYQAWVEQQGIGDQQGGGEEGKGSLNNVDEEGTEGGDNEDIQDSKPEGNDDIGSSYSWDSNSFSSSSVSTTSQSVQEDTSGDIDIVQCNKPNDTITNYYRSMSLDNYLENEVETPDFANPLMFGPSSSAPRSGEFPSQSNSLSGWTSGTTQQRRQRSNVLYIQMEYCNTTMRDMIDESKLTIDNVWKSLRQILEALVYIHGMNVIHRDLKPAK